MTWLFTVAYLKWFSILWRLSYSFFLEFWLVLRAEVTFLGVLRLCQKQPCSFSSGLLEHLLLEPWGTMEEANYSEAKNIMIKLTLAYGEAM